MRVKLGYPATYDLREVTMNIIFRSKNKIMTVAVVIGALVLFPIQPVFAQPFTRSKGTVSIKLLSMAGIFTEQKLAEAVINQLERATSVIRIYSTA